MAKHTWKKTRGWHSHSVACWDAEWAEYRLAAELAGKSLNGWIRSYLNEGVRYERALAAERADTSSGGLRD